MNSLSNDEKISRTQANLPLPEDPPNVGDFNSADGNLTNVGSGGVQSDFSVGDATSSGLRGPATGGSAVREDGSDGYPVSAINAGRVPGGVPNDAVTESKKGSAGLENTTNADRGYPQQSDPAGSMDAKISGRGNDPTA